MLAVIKLGLNLKSVERKMVLDFSFLSCYCAAVRTCDEIGKKHEQNHYVTDSTVVYGWL